MKNLLLITSILLVSCCGKSEHREADGTPPQTKSTTKMESSDVNISLVKKADPQIRTIAAGEPYLERDFKILDAPGSFDAFCAEEFRNGEIWYHQGKDDLLRPCVSNSNGQWVLVPDGETIPWLNCQSNIKVMGMDVVDPALPQKGKYHSMLPWPEKK